MPRAQGADLPLLASSFAHTAHLRLHYFLAFMCSPLLDAEALQRGMHVYSRSRWWVLKPSDQGPDRWDFGDIWCDDAACLNGPPKVVTGNAREETWRPNLASSILGRQRQTLPARVPVHVCTPCTSDAHGSCIQEHQFRVLACGRSHKSDVSIYAMSVIAFQCVSLPLRASMSGKSVGTPGTTTPW